jgi:hypothetical protein
MVPVLFLQAGKYSPQDPVRGKGKDNVQDGEACVNYGTGTRHIQEV